MLPAAVEPAQCEVERLTGIGLVRHSRGALVESHHDVGADGTLDIDRFLGGEQMLRSVDMAAEPRPLFGQLAVV